ncbi:hypothetical protein L1887_50580 [Cichorium endivia]|nr:hypothetical protein L1887_50580 [Cichorium endivia]
MRSKIVTSARWRRASALASVQADMGHRVEAPWLPCIPGPRPDSSLCRCPGLRCPAVRLVCDPGMSSQLDIQIPLHCSSCLPVSLGQPFGSLRTHSTFTAQLRSRSVTLTPANKVPPNAILAALLAALSLRTAHRCSILPSRDDHLRAPYRPTINQLNPPTPVIAALNNSPCTPSSRLRPV